MIGRGETGEQWRLANWRCNFRYPMFLFRCPTFAIVSLQYALALRTVAEQVVPATAFSIFDAFGGVTVFVL